MHSISTQQVIVYIGEFDLRHENVQAHLVKNNAKIFNKLGYKVVFIGVNRLTKTFSEIAKLNKIDMGLNSYLELPNTLNLSGIFNFLSIVRKVIDYCKDLKQKNTIKYVISYQSPTYAPLIKKIGLFCYNNGIPYIVNSADIPVFDSQPIFKRYIMKYNWHLLHKYSYKYANGVIAVSRYIDSFYAHQGRPSIIVPPLFDEQIDFDFSLNETVTFVYAGTPFIDSITKVNTAGMKDRLDKVVDMFLQLAETEVKFRFVIIGITKEKYNLNVPRHLEALRSDDHIVFRGRLPHADTLREVKNADYMINYRDKNPMTEAGMSTKVVESVSLGTPVIMNSIGDTFNYLKEGISGYQLTGDMNTDVGLLKRLCIQNEYHRLNSKMCCANSKTFLLETFTDTFVSFFNKFQ